MGNSKSACKTSALRSKTQLDRFPSLPHQGKMKKLEYLMCQLVLLLLPAGQVMQWSHGALERCRLSLSHPLPSPSRTEVHVALIRPIALTFVLTGYLSALPFILPGHLMEHEVGWSRLDFDCLLLFVSCLWQLSPSFVCCPLCSGVLGSYFLNVLFRIKNKQINKNLLSPISHRISTSFPRVTSCVPHTCVSTNSNHGSGYKS